MRIILDKVPLDMIKAMIVNEETLEHRDLGRFSCVQEVSAHLKELGYTFKERDLTDSLYGSAEAILYENGRG